MKKTMRKVSLNLVLCLILMMMMSPITIYANDSSDSEKESSGLKYYIGEVYNTGKDTGYSECNTIKEDDPHYGWELGKFFINGYTRVKEDEDKEVIFLKNVGNKITLWFNLEEDIQKLNGDENISICGDVNGYDEYFGVEKTDFGHGTLIVKYTDYQNLSKEAVIYTDYLSSKVLQSADTKVECFEEGDYEVSLDYEIKNSPRKIFGQDIIPTYTNYKICFKFSVRNGNCMVYPFDVKTKGELTNSNNTVNGFYLDLAKSRYLDIDIKKEVMKESADGLVEDIRFNRPARDGEKFTDEGIYTISVSNKYTNQKTEKKIYVGTNEIMMASCAMNMSIKDVEAELARGSNISEDGTIILAENLTDKKNIANESETNSTNTTMIMIAILVVLAIAVIIIVMKKKKSNNDMNTDNQDSNDRNDNNKNFINKNENSSSDSDLSVKEDEKNIDESNNDSMDDNRNEEGDR